MLEQQKLLEDLSLKQQAFVVAALLFGRSELEQIFKCLPATSVETLNKTVSSVQAMERHSRVSFLVAHLKRLLRYQQLSALTHVHPTWIHHALLAETPWVIQAILQKLSASAAKAVVSNFPELIQKELAAIASHKIHPLVVEAAYQKVENAFAPPPFRELGDTFELEDLPLFNGDDWLLILVNTGALFGKDLLLLGPLAEAAKSLREKHKVEQLYFMQLGTVIISALVYNYPEVFHRQIAQAMPLFYGQMFLEQLREKPPGTLDEKWTEPIKKKFEGLVVQLAYDKKLSMVFSTSLAIV